MEFEDTATAIEDTPLHPKLKEFFLNNSAPNGYLAANLDGDHFKRVCVIDDFEFEKSICADLYDIMLHVFNGDYDKWEDEFRTNNFPASTHKFYKRLVELFPQQMFYIKGSSLYKGINNGAFQ